ncbi:MAG: aminotransferase class V-fold PLP-dependent enzyme, partial [Kangiellaceae bacterium]|nr:aminotransferase class V-fold PLP-dependent enzyme [Kangiellaceae bacterium]
GATPIATFADWLVTSFDQNLSSGIDSVASQVERQAIQWLCEMFYLPPSFKGLMTTGATASNFLGALLARDFCGQQQGLNVAKDGVTSLSIEVFAATPHSSMLKTLGMCGLGQNCIVKIKTLDNSEAMCLKDLKQQLEQSNAKSKVIIASAATVTATDFDDLSAISEIAHQYEAWLHVDAAFGMFERLVNQPRLSHGIENADSITLDCHKWLNVPYDCGVFLTRHQDLLFGSLNVPAPYLNSSIENPDFMALGIENSRRFRALPVWMSLLVYGREGIAKWVESNIKLAKLFADKITKSPHYQLLHDCKLNVVLFTPKVDEMNAEQADILTCRVRDEINQDGRIFVSAGMWQGKQCIRAAFSNWQSRVEDVEIAMQCLDEVATKFGGQTL